MFKLDNLNNPMTSALIGAVAQKLTNGSSKGSVTEIVSTTTEKSPVSKEKGTLVESFFSAVGNNVDPATVMSMFSSFVHDSKKEEANALAAQNNLSGDSILKFLNESLSKGSLDFSSPAFRSIASALNPLADDDHDGESNLQESLKALFGKYSNQ